MAIRITPELRAAFSALSWNQAWDILHIIPGNFHYLYNFCWPDGTPMEGWQTYEKPRELTKEERVIKKCQNLDAKFKSKSLPKCTTKPLSFPDKKVPLPNKKETGSINDDFLHFLSTNTYRPRTAITGSRAGITGRTASWVYI